jgi:hypothetical protein
MTGVQEITTRAPREGRPIGINGIGERAIRDKDGEMTGADRLHRALLLLLLLNRLNFQDSLLRPMILHRLR